MAKNYTLTHCYAKDLESYELMNAKTRLLIGFFLSLEPESVGII